MSLVDTQGIENVAQAFGLGADVVAAGRAIAVTEAGEIEGDHSVAVGEVAGKTQPVILVGREAMNQYQGFAVWRSSW